VKVAPSLLPLVLVPAALAEPLPWPLALVLMVVSSLWPPVPRTVLVAR